MNERYDHAQWVYDLIKNAYLNKSDELNDKDNLYLNYLYPFSEVVYSPHNSMMLFGGHSFENVLDKTEVLARDGLIPLTIFFREVEPSEISNQIFIPKDLWFIVPVKWREKVKFYEVKAHSVYSSTNLPKKIFISGILNSTLADPDEFEQNLIQLSESIGSSNIKNIEIVAYFPDKRNDLWGSWEEENVLKFSALIFKHLKNDVKTPAWKNLKVETSFRDCLYHEVNTGVFIKDSFLSHFTLSRGAGLLDYSSIVPADERFRLISETRLSLYHSYYFYDFDYSDVVGFDDPLLSKHARYFKRISDFQNKGICLNYDWEKWYASYIRKFYKLRKKGSSSLFNS